MWWYTPLCKTRRSPLCPVWVICPSVNLQKTLLWTVICPTVFYLLVKDSNIENIYNITVDRVWLYIVPANVQHILVWFGINLQGSFDPFRWSFSDDHPWSPLRATLLSSVAPSPKSPKVSLQLFYQIFWEFSQPFVTPSQKSPKLGLCSFLV